MNQSGPAGGEQRPLVSIITRTFNRRELFRGAIKSVAEQSWRALELVVVNDGGETVGDIIDPYRDHMPIVYLEPGHVGRCKAGNLAMEAARGEYFAYLDDDDRFDPWHLDFLMEALLSSDFKVAYSDAYQVDMSLDRESGTWKEVSRSIPYSEDFDRLLLFQKAYIHIVTFIHHREAFEHLGGFDESLEVLEDWDLFFRYAQDYDFLHVPRATASFHVRDDGSNAITMYRREFVETRTKLYAKYSHMVMGEMLSQMAAGRQEVEKLRREVSALRQELARLKGGSP